MIPTFGRHEDMVIVRVQDVPPGVSRSAFYELHYCEKHIDDLRVGYARGPWEEGTKIIPDGPWFCVVREDDLKDLGEFAP